jgi:hypothetical protein
MLDLMMPVASGGSALRDFALGTPELAPDSGADQAWRTRTFSAYAEFRLGGADAWLNSAWVEITRCAEIKSRQLLAKKKRRGGKPIRSADLLNQCLQNLNGVL